MIKRFSHFFFIIQLFYGLIVANDNPVIKTTFDNGFTVLIYPINTLQSVSIQLWTKVGSKHEQDGEKGLAHLLEHMLFKGTKNLSETDIDLITNKLSGYCNAETYYDWTRYYFNLPIQHSLEAIFILAEMFNNAILDDEYINSELKTVIQELKEGKDYYHSILVNKLLSSSLPDHPYRNPIIGYKQNIWNMNHDTLMKFYKKHYIPNNAFLVVVGNVNPNEVIASAKEHFGNLMPNFEYTQPIRFHNQDLSKTSITLYRTVEQPSVRLSFLIPGAAQLNPQCLPNVLTNLLTEDKDTLLYKALIDELDLVYNISSSASNVDIDYNSLDIVFEPKNIDDIDLIIDIIIKKINKLKSGTISEGKLKIIADYMELDYNRRLENNFSIANEIAFNYLGRNDENYMFNTNFQEITQLKPYLISFIDTYIRPSLMHVGYILPIKDADKKYWQQLQEKSDQEDTEILAQRIRTKEIEPGKYVHQVTAKKMPDIPLPKPAITKLQNGLTLNYYANTTIPMIDIILDFNNSIYNEPQHLLGISPIARDLIFESGTKQYPGIEFEKEVEKYCMEISLSNHSITVSVPSKYFEKALMLLEELIFYHLFDKDKLAKIKEHHCNRIRHFWNDEHTILNQLIDEHIYKNHPYSINYLGTEETINAITVDDIRTFLHENYHSTNSELFIVGDIDSYDVPALVQQYIGNTWGKKKPIPPVEKAEKKTITYKIDRNQIQIAFAGTSIPRDHKDYYKLALANQAFNTYLFQLRQKSGAMYSIAGCLTVDCSGCRPGKIIIKTTVSYDRLEEVIAMIKDAISNFPEQFTQEDLNTAKRAFENEPADAYSTNQSIASTFSNISGHNKSYDFFAERLKEIEQITVEEVQETLQKVLDLEHMAIFKVGRIT